MRLEFYRNSTVLLGCVISRGTYHLSVLWWWHEASLHFVLKLHLIGIWISTCLCAWTLTVGIVLLSISPLIWYCSVFLYSLSSVICTRVALFLPDLQNHCNCSHQESQNFFQIKRVSLLHVGNNALCLDWPHVLLETTLERRSHFLHFTVEDGSERLK